MRNKKLIVAFLGMLPHDREFHGFQLFFFSFSAGTQPLFFCTASSSHLTSCLHSLISIELFLLTTLPNSSSSENPPLVPVISLSTFLLCFLFSPKPLPTPLFTAQPPPTPLLQPPPWQGGHILATRLMHATHLWKSSPTPFYRDAQLFPSG